LKWKLEGFFLNSDQRSVGALFLNGSMVVPMRFEWWIIIDRRRQ